MDTPVQLTKLAQCAGCGAKVGAGVLTKLLSGLPLRHDPRLLVGYDKSDDASVFQLTPDIAIVQTLDFFPPIADDPYTFGQIAAANALSDIYAMGAEPVLAMNILCITNTLSHENVQSILRGGYEKVYEAGALISGGHSIEGPEPMYGLSVTGLVHPAKYLTNSSALEGDVLILTKPLGIGILTTAAKAELLPREDEKRIFELMTTLNKKARDIMVQYEIHSCTDITGFGLLGHSLEMAQGSKVTIALDSAAIPVLPLAQDFAAMGILPAGMYRNRSFAAAGVHFADRILLSMQDVLFDPQTSGGLLIAVAEKDAAALLLELQNQLEWPRIIGHVKARQENLIEVI